MPELPEVETIKRIIESQIKGLKISGVDVCNRQIVAHPTTEEFAEVLLGRVFVGIKRRGKFLIFELDNGDSLFLHLRMTGQLLVTSPEYPLEKHIHLLIHLKNGHLYAAGIHPDTKCKELTEAEWKLLAKTIPEVLIWAIEKNFITPEDYLAGKGKEYRNTPFLKAYGHAGKECTVCGSIFQKITVGGRSSCYCPGCQKLNE